MSGDDQLTLEPGAERELVMELAALVLEQAAPEELPFLDETAAEYFADPSAVLDPRRRDEALGFGVDAAMLAPFILAVVTPAVKFLAATVAESLRDEARPRIEAIVRRLLRGKAAEADGGKGAAQQSVPALTPTQAGRVRQIAFERATALGLSETRAALLADSVVGGVVVAG